ncbi:MAG: cysteine--tRNA ligase [Candidatus Goldbacteria bacterium]|nr:cysteine--tRNA ligase [Candidatus Goldiibacteriota bacterium]
MKLHNTMTGKTEEFVPVTAGEVKMYVCGPTVYNYFHIGNARIFVVFDTIRKYFEYSGYKVIFVQNITDIEDKIINKAAAENITWQDVVNKYTDAYFEDTQALKVKKPDVSPRATEEIEGMIKMISVLIEKGNAYASKNGVYFSVASFNGYGKLSHRNIDDLQEGARVDVDEEKKSPLDFALWKFSKPGEPFWESPWGKGRPGWHIECSVMSSKYLAETFDIHGGGADLIFPHHENEIAQSEACTGKEFAKYWMHGGYMNIKGEKMSKSKGNFVMVRDLLKDFSAEVIRMFILSAHYRGPLDFSYENMEPVKKGYSEYYYTLQRLNQRLEGININEQIKPDNKFIAEFKSSMDEDFNTSKAQAVIYNCLAEIKSKLPNMTDTDAAEYDAVLRVMGGVLGIVPEIKPVDLQVVDLVKQIGVLRAEKKYEEADLLKKKAADTGYILEFTKARTYIIRELQ